MNGMSQSSVRVGLISTSWWADAMYMPALQNHPHCHVTAVSGRNRERLDAFADRWSIGQRFTDPFALIKSGLCDAIIVATANDSHHPFTMAALAEGLHVLCEKPIGLDYGEASEMAQAARQARVITSVPFTYRFMPTARYIKKLLDEDYIGRPYHLNMRYYTGYGREAGYKWRFDNRIAGSGNIGDIGSHFLYLAEWYFGEIASLSCQLSYLVDRGSVAPDGEPFERGDDGAIITLQFASGAQGAIHVSSLAYEDTPFGQTHHMEFHGSGGSLYHLNDWDTVQQVSGAQVGEGMIKPLDVPAHIWGNVRRDTVHNTYRDVFRQELLMIGEFIDGIRANQPVEPNIHDGARIQRLIDACVLSHREGRRVAIGSIR